MSFLSSWTCTLALLALAPRFAAQEHEAPSAEPTTAPGERPSGAPRFTVSRVDTRDGPRWTVFAPGTELAEVVRALAKKAGLAVENSNLLPRNAKVSLELERRPLEEVLEFLLGTAGLRHELTGGSLVVLAPSTDPADLAHEADVAWQRVSHGNDPEAAFRARLAQGNLAEVRGDLEGAFALYRELAEEDHSPLAAEATYRAGRVLERLGHWAEAAQHFRTLASSDEGRAFHTRARLELARASIELGDPESALHLLNFLETNYPIDDPLERAERRLVRASACNANHEYVEALRTLEDGETVTAPDSEARGLEIRAAAFEGLGFGVEAARAWLLYARMAPANERNAAFERAARLSLEGGDELGTLFVCREAAKQAADESLGALVRQARSRLGLDQADVPASIHERLERAEELLADEKVAEATELFEGLYLARGALEEPERARVLAGWTRCIVDRSGLDAALEILSKARASFEDPAAIQRLDLAAAALLESAGEFDRAAEAYGGVY